MGENPVKFQGIVVRGCKNLIPEALIALAIAPTVMTASDRLDRFELELAIGLYYPASRPVKSSVLGSRPGQRSIFRSGFPDVINGKVFCEQLKMQFLLHFIK